jgi:hypothetical protein
VLRLILVVGLVLALGALALTHRRAEAAERRLAAIASVIANRDVNVHCQGAVAAALDVSSEAGSVMFDADGRPADTAELKRGVCSALRRFERDRQKPAFACLARDERCPDEVIRSAWAVQTLSHEAWHLAGEVDEARTECFGLQTTAYVAVQLGAERHEAQALASISTGMCTPRCLPVTDQVTAGTAAR